MDALFQFINHLSPIDAKSEYALKRIIRPRSVTKGEVIYSTNTYCRELFFVKSGLLKMQFNSNGNDFIMRFFEENIICTDLDSFTKKKPSDYELVALENTELWIIPFEKFENLCLTYHDLETFYRKLMTLASLNMMQRIKEMLEENARKRYENFVQNYPKLMQRITLGDLSKYLGITQVSLSRIRTNKST